MCDFNKKLNKNFQVFFEIENFNKIKGKIMINQLVKGCQFKCFFLEIITTCC